MRHIDGPTGSKAARATVGPLLLLRSQPDEVIE